MPDIVARWEWRTFSEDPTILNRVLGEYQPTTLVSSEETYFLVSPQNLNVKIRNHILDVKQKIMTHPDGMEQWFPVFKCNFPISGNPLEEFAAILDLNMEDDGQALDESFFKQILNTKTDIVSVSLAKSRNKYDIDGVQAEFTALNINTKMLYTLALEHIDNERISILRKELSLEHLNNENYPQALKRLLALDKGDV